MPIEKDVPDQCELFRLKAGVVPFRNLISGPDLLPSDSDGGDGDGDHSAASLHEAAFYVYLPTVRALLACPTDGRILEQLFSRDNAEGLTPLEACEQHQRSLRETTELDPLRVWSGYDPDALRIIYLLKRAMGEDVVVSEDEFVRIRRYGCTCERCTDGWLSPRMRYVLSCTCCALHARPACL